MERMQSLSRALLQRRTQVKERAHVLHALVRATG